MTATLDAPVTSPLWHGPGIYTADELSLEAYHQDVVPGGSLSSSGARALLDPGCPAQFDHDRKHPKAPKSEFEIGTAAHKLVLGEGPDLVRVDADEWRTAAVKAEVAAIRDRGAIPLKPDTYQQIHAMADALRRDGLAGPLLTPGRGTAEQSLYWADPHTGVICRCRPDWLMETPDLTICIDYKTTRDASPRAVSKAIGDYHYHQQAAWYLDGIQQVLGKPARFVLVSQAKTAPYLVTTREIAEADLAIGRAKNAKALRIYAECERTGQWPDWTGPVDEIPTIALPTWQATREAEEYLNV
jgi:hypothetical protein